MAIVIKLEEIMAERKVSLKTLASSVGITMTNMSRLKTSKVKSIRFSTLDAVCSCLDCQPGDLLEYVSDEQRAPCSSAQLRESASVQLE